MKEHLAAHMHVQKKLLALHPQPSSYLEAEIEAWTRAMVDMWNHKYGQTKYARTVKPWQDTPHEGHQGPLPTESCLYGKIVFEAI